MSEVMQDEEKLKEIIQNAVSTVLSEDRQAVEATDSNATKGITTDEYDNRDYIFSNCVSVLSTTERFRKQELIHLSYVVRKNILTITFITRETSSCGPRTSVF